MSPRLLGTVGLLAACASLSVPLPLRAQRWAPFPRDERPERRQALRFGAPKARYEAAEWFVRRGAQEADREVMWRLLRRASPRGLRRRLWAALAAWSPPRESLLLAASWAEMRGDVPWSLRALAASPGEAPLRVLLARPECHGVWRRACVEALRWRLPDELPRWLRWLRDTAHPVPWKMRLIEALAPSVPPPARAALVRLHRAGSGASPWVRRAAGRLLRRAAGRAPPAISAPPQAWPDGCPIWAERFGRCPERIEPPEPGRGDPAERADRLALAAACAHRWPSGTERRGRARILEAFDAPEPLVRAAAAWAVGRLGWRAARRWLLEALWDESAWVRFAAARALGRWPLRSSEVAVLRARWILDPSERVRAALRDASRGEGPTPAPLGERLHWRRPGASRPGSWLQVLWPDGRLGWVAPRCRLPEGVPEAPFAPAAVRWRWRPVEASQGMGSAFGP